MSCLLYVLLWHGRLQKSIEFEKIREIKSTFIILTSFSVEMSCSECNFTGARVGRCLNTTISYVMSL